MKKVQHMGKRAGALILTASLLVTGTDLSVLADSTDTAQKQGRYLLEQENCVIDYQITGEWEGYRNVQVTITNTGEGTLDNWALSYPEDGVIENIWNAQVIKQEDRKVCIKNSGYNQDVNAYESVSFGYTVKADTTVDTCSPDYMKLVSKAQRVPDGEFTAAYTVCGSWDGGLTGEIEISNIRSTKLEDWTLEFDYANEISSMWNGEIISHEGSHYVVKNPSYNQNIDVMCSTAIGFIADNKVEDAKPQNVSLTEITVGEEVEDTELPKEPAEDEMGLLDGVYIKYPNGNTRLSVIDDLTFVSELGEEETEEEEKAEVSWVSSDPEVIDETGKVTRGETSQNVVISAIVRKDGEVYQKEFELTVVGEMQIDSTALTDYTMGDLERLNAEDEDYEIELDNYGYLCNLYGKYSDVTVDSYESALYSLYNIRFIMGIENPLEELQVYDSHVGDTGYIYKFEQVYKGIPVFSSCITVSADADGVTDAVFSNYYPVTEMEVTPALTVEEVQECVRERYESAEFECDGEKPLYVLNYYGNSHLVWSMYMTVHGEEDIESGQYHVLVDAMDGSIEYKCGTKSYASETVIDSGVDLLGEDRNFYTTRKYGAFTDDRYEMVDRKRKIWVYDGNGEIYEPVYGKDGKIKYEKYHWGKAELVEKENKDWAPVYVSAMANMKTVYDYYKDELYRTSYDDAFFRWGGNKIKVYVNTGEKDNAFWDPVKKIFIFGDGESGIWKDISSAAALDVVGHEFTHGIIYDETKLQEVNTGVPRSIDEAYADIMACCMEYQETITEESEKEKGGVWTIGEDVTFHSMRNIRNPEKTNSPRRYKGQYYLPYIDKPIDPAIHQNSVIVSHAAYLMNEQYGIDMITLQNLWYESLCMGYEKHSDFYDVRKKVVKAAKKLKLDDEDIAGIKQAFTDVNITKDADENNQSYFEQLDRLYFSEDYFSDEITFYGKVISAGINEENVDGEGSAVITNVYTPIERVDVVIENADHTFAVETKTDRRGDYCEKADYAQMYLLNFKKEGYLDTTLYFSGIDKYLQNEYYCDTVNMIPEKYAGKGGAAGTIRDAKSSWGIEGLHLVVRKGINNIYTDEIVQDTYTEKDGMYQIENLDAGNYCVQVLDEKGRYLESCFNIVVFGGVLTSQQDGVVCSQLLKDQVRVVLTWGNTPRDLDSHMLVTLSDDTQGHVYYSDRFFYKKGIQDCTLDHDDVNGFGPETVTVSGQLSGIYTYYVYNFSKDCGLDLSCATVKVYIGGNAMPSYTFHVPTEGLGPYWTVFRYNSATKRLVPVNRVSNKVEK